MKSALTIAGSDSGGGAGIQADLKSFAAVGVHGTCVITCITAQNTRSVDSIFPLPLEEIQKQLRAVISDFEIGAAKTGMLYSAEIVRTVAKEIGRTKFPLVVDPVMVATVGAPLQQDGFREALVEHLLPHAMLVTPNRYEAERLAGVRVRDTNDAERAARIIRKLGPAAVLVKGGHLGTKLVDVFYDGRTMRHLFGYRHAKELHGAGCTLAASIAAYLAQGSRLHEAVESARNRVAAGFATSYRAGRGVAIISSHYRPDRYEIWSAVTETAPALARAVPVELAPEVGINLGYALPSATTPADVCALQGRIVRVGDRLEVAGPAAFGASKHIARIILTAMRFDPTLRCATNLKYWNQAERRLRSSGLVASSFDRANEPRGVSTMEWGTEQAIAKKGRIPDMIYDEGALGKEAMLRVLGKNPQDVLRKVRRIIRLLRP